jgi:GNAT superfamily N-acetyltransferase
VSTGLSVAVPPPRSPSQPVRVRRAAATDREAVRRLLLALGYEADDRGALAALLGDVLLRPDLELFLAIAHDGAPVGLLQLSQRPQLHLGGTVVCIDALVVAPEARGRGIGRRLLRRARAYARLHRAVRIEVHTTRARENYRRGFYPANGYREAASALFRLAELETGRGPRLPDGGAAPATPGGATTDAAGRADAAASNAASDSVRVFRAASANGTKG